VVVDRAPQRKTQRQDEFDKAVLALDVRIKEIIAKGGHLIFADESIFAARGFQNRAYARPYENICVEDRTGKQPCQAVCAAVCACHQLLNIEVEDYSFDAEKFLNFLKGVAGACGKERIYLFLDNS